MSTFTWNIEVGSSRNVEPRVLSSKFGDGYEQRTPDGINTMPRTWDVTIKLSKADMDALEAFMIARGGAEAFVWTPPDGTSGKWACRSWRISTPYGLWREFTGKFEEVFE